MMTRFRLIGATLAGLALLALAPTAHAQNRPLAVSIGKIATEKSCTVYQESAGRSATVVTPFSIATAASWRTWLVKDCVSNFATMRASLEAALASTGKFAVTSKGSAYSVAVTVSQVGGEPGAAPRAPNPGEEGFSVSSRYIFATMAVTLRDASGRTVYGGVLTKRLETGSNIKTAGLQTRSSESGEAVYSELQNEMALAVARLVAFHITPLVVVGGGGDEIRLNYGSPLLTLGTIVQVTNPSGGAAVRYAVVSSDPSGSTANLDGEGDRRNIGPGSVAIVIEPEDPAINQRRIKRVDLP